MKQVLLCVLLSLSLSANVLALGNAGAGKTKAAVCGGCHGVDGNSALPTYPKLAGQNERYIAQQLTDFKTGKTRSNAIMQGMATPLSRQDIADIGTYFQSQSISSTAPFDRKKQRRVVICTMVGICRLEFLPVKPVMGQLVQAMPAVVIHS